jgi:hypothetical protein
MRLNGRQSAVLSHGVFELIATYALGRRALGFDQLHCSRIEPRIPHSFCAGELFTCRGDDVSKLPSAP